MVTIGRRFTRDAQQNECSIEDKFKFISQSAKMGVPSYYLNRLCKIKYISKEKDIVFFFFDEPLTDRKIPTATFNKCCQKHLA